MSLTAVKSFFAASWNKIGLFRSPAEVAASQRQIEEQLDLLSKMSRAQRKQLLYAENQDAMLRDISNKISMLDCDWREAQQQNASSGFEGYVVSMDEEEVVDVLDDLARVNEALVQESLAHRIVEDLCVFYCEKSGFIPIAARGAVCQGVDYEIVDSVHEQNSAPGTIVKIVKQGYHRANGSKIRSAQVVVATNI